MTDPTKRKSVKQPAAKMTPKAATKHKTKKAPIEGKKTSALFGGPKKMKTPYN
jgi:hypothetical protein